MIQSNSPVIVGAAQFTNPKDAPNRMDPLRLMEISCKKAFKDTGSERLKDFIDSLYVSHMFSWSYRDIPGELSNLLEIYPKGQYYMFVGGNIPQRVINRSANEIALGKIKGSLMTGAEAFYSLNMMKHGIVKGDWPRKKNPKAIEEFDIKDLGSTEFENFHYFGRAADVYALFETSLRAFLGRSIEDHRIQMGKLLEHLANVAKSNPYAWKREGFSKTTDTIASENNRYICHPYTKRMIAYHYVDQTSAVIMTSKAIAKELNIDKRKWVYPMGGADLKNIRYVTQRPKLHTAPALKKASQLALTQAGITLNDINAFDIYSCFPCMVEIACQELGIPENDERNLTITGGLPFFGGPMHNYSMHAIVTAVTLIRENPDIKILITANGGYNSKHSVGVYGSVPGKEPWGMRDDSHVQKMIDSKALEEPVTQYNGIMIIDGYTIMYKTDGTPKRALVIGFAERNRRTLAVIEDKVERIKELEQVDLIGKKCNVIFNPETRRNYAILL
ncbi:MAG: hypothetical protein ACTSR8_19505 [Promethearchaeota archaeon]